jgi:hypothetical protein
MSREQIGTPQAYPDFDGEDHVIGLRAVAAAVRYQGETNNAEHVPKKGARPPAAAPVRDSES